MTKITIEEFMKLSEKEKCEKYKDLSNHDKFLARISQPLSPRVIPEDELTEEEKEKIKEMKNDTKTLEEMEKFAEKHIAKLKEIRKNKRKSH